jgi:uncharacterized integral membrane protein
MKSKELPTEFNPLINKFEPILPTKKEGPIFKKRKINWWMLGYLIVSLLMLIFALINLSRN